MGSIVSKSFLTDRLLRDSPQRANNIDQPPAAVPTPPMALDVFVPFIPSQSMGSMPFPTLSESSSSYKNIVARQMMPMPMADFLSSFVPSALAAPASAFMPNHNPIAQRHAMQMFYNNPQLTFSVFVPFNIPPSPSMPFPTWDCFTGTAAFGENEKTIIVQPASKFVWMATEVWADVSGFIERPQLARSVSLTNRLLHQLCWPRMHGNRVVPYEIRGLRIECGEPFDSCRPAKAILLKDDGREVPFPNCPAPDYISGFGQITISFLDGQVLEFLTFISPCLNEVFLSLYWIKLNAKQTASVNQLLHIFREEFPNTILSVECTLASVPYFHGLDNKMQGIYLTVKEESDIQLLMQMLATPRADEKQRAILLEFCYKPELAQKVLDAIKQEFHAAIRPLPNPFYIRFCDGNLPPALLREEWENTQTNEALVTMPNDEYADELEVYRYPTCHRHEQLAEEGRSRLLAIENNSTNVLVDLKNPFWPR